MINANMFRPVSSIVDMINNRCKNKLEANNDLDSAKIFFKKTQEVSITETEKEDVEEKISGDTLLAGGAVPITPARTAASAVTQVIGNLRKKVFSEKTLNDSSLNLHEIEAFHLANDMKDAEEGLSTSVSSLMAAFDTFTEQTGKTVDTQGLDLENLLNMSLDDAIETLVTAYNRIADLSDGQVSKIGEQHTNYYTTFKRLDPNFIKNLEDRKEHIEKITAESKLNGQSIVDISENSLRIMDLIMDNKNWNLLDQRG